MKNQDKYAENYFAHSDLSVLMDNFLEATLYTVLEYSFSFVLLLAVTSEFFQFHLTDFHFQLLQLSLSENKRKGKRRDSAERNQPVRKRRNII